METKEQVEFQDTQESLENQVAYQFSSVQLLSHVRLFATPWTAACQASLSITNSWSWPKLMSIESVMSSNHLILCLPFLLLPSILPSIKVLSNELALCIRWSKYWSLSFSISLFNEYSGLISLRIDWFDQKRVFAMTSVLFSWQNSVSLFVLQDQTCLLL